jgi:hypothetical protein
MNSMVVRQYNTPVGSSCRLWNDGVQTSKDEITRVDSLRLPFCCAADPLLLPTVQEVSQAEYYQYEQKKQRGKRLCQDELVLLEPHVIAPCPTPFDADPSQKIQQLVLAPTPAHPTPLRYVMKQDLTVRTAQQNNDPSENQKRKNVFPESYHPPRQASTSSIIVLEHNNDRPSMGCSKRNRQTPETRKPVSSESRELPKDFVPRPWSVIVGRDKASLQAPGNNKLRMIVRLHLERYSKCGDNKDEKTRIISEIESTIRRNCLKDCEGCQEEELGAFIKVQDGKWWEVSSWVAREKIGRMLREYLHTKYSSSSRRKRARRLLLESKTVERMEKDVPAS